MVCKYMRKGIYKRAKSAMMLKTRDKIKRSEICDGICAKYAERIYKRAKSANDAAKQGTK